MAKDFKPITLALAGVFQASTLVAAIARRGHYDTDAFATSIGSLFHIDAPDIDTIYGGHQQLELGLRKLWELFGDNDYQPDADIGRYVLSLVILERKLAKDKQRLAQLSSRIQQAKQQSEYFNPTHSNVLANLADTYLEVISTFNFRIQVVGKQSLLEQQDNLNRIRALLLAGIRSAVLWRQVGGNRWQLFFQRRKMAKIAETLLQS